jgi:hypothetical protein
MIQLIVFVQRFLPVPFLLARAARHLLGQYMQGTASPYLLFDAGYSSFIPGCLQAQADTLGCLNFSSAP